MEQSNFIFGKKIPIYGKFIVIENLIFYINKTEKINETMLKIKNLIFPYIGKILNVEEINSLWDNLNKINNSEQSFGEFILKTFNVYHDKESLLFKTFQTFSKIKPLEKINEWFDNFRLNALSNGLNLIVWDDKNLENVFGVRRNFEKINESIELEDYDEFVRIYVSSLRKFIIENDFFQTNYSNNYKIVEPIEKKLSSKEILDICYNNYPFFYGGAFTCDFYKFKSISQPITELVKFSDRYPSAILGWILNTSTYGQSGEHWVAFILKNSIAYLICSGGNNFSNFKDNGELKNYLMKLNVAIEFNPIKVQTDSFSCGMFSLISLYKMICNNCNIEKTIDEIGKNGEKLVEGKNILSFTKVLACPK